MIAWIQRQLLAIGALAALLVSVFLYGRKSGKQSRAEQEKEDVVNAVESRKEIEQDVAREPDGGAADRLRDDWSRD